MFQQAGEWLRCALHAHTTESDGELSPALLAGHYRRAGYDVLAITDHWRRTIARSRDGLIVVPSSELSCVLPREREAHVLAFGIRDDPLALVATRPDLAAAARWVGEQGGVAYLAHPYWTGASGADLDLPDGVVGLEVYNAGCELEVARGLSAVHWDDVLERGRPCFAIATDDSHHPGFDSDYGWVWVRAEERSPEAVLDALAAGRFYSSTGPTIDAVEVEDRAVEVRCSPCRSVTLVTGRERGSAFNAGRLGYRYRAEPLALARGGLASAVRLQRPPRNPYGRVEIVDAEGRKAWTNPLWMPAEPERDGDADAEPGAHVPPC